ncbi:hypothetical protein SESBI_13304 [Sesbania bispinosa]|nr:hypothetical protein SESBI_13304 [Sesbania bispinosa]
MAVNSSSQDLVRRKHLLTARNHIKRAIEIGKSSSSVIVTPAENVRIKTGKVKTVKINNDD